MNNIYIILYILILYSTGVLCCLKKNPSKDAHLKNKKDTMLKQIRCSGHVTLKWSLIFTWHIYKYAHMHINRHK